MAASDDSRSQYVALTVYRNAWLRPHSKVKLWGVPDRMRRGTVASLSIIACFVTVLFLSTPSLSAESIALPILMDDEGFNVTITYYYVSGPNTVVLIGSVESPQSSTLVSLTASASINGVTVGSGAVDEQNLQLTGGVAAPVSATVTTNFNIYDALWFGEVAVGDGTTIPFNYDSTPITVLLSGQVCLTAPNLDCLPWPLFNQTSTLAML